MVQARLPSRYRVIEEVGQGGMAVVYKAHDESLKREVAVKLLHPHLLAEPESKTRLEREAQAVAKLHHDNIVQIFDYSGSDASSSYIVTEFIDGQTLKQFITNRKPPPPEVAGLIAIEIGNALLHAHSLGIIHRDVKPDNVMVRKDGMLKLMDFGVAQIMDLERMTVTGQLLGSPAYMAPELLEGRPLDVRTDVFSVGILLYQLATGSLPFSGRNPHEVLKRIAEGKFADPRTLNRLIADRLAKIIARALARRPDDRYPQVAVLVEDLSAFVADAGMGVARDELGQYFRAPDAYEKEVVPRMIAALVASGKHAREGKQTAKALELWNRALAMDPSNREVLTELKHAASRQHLQRGLVAVASAAALTAGAYFALRQAGGPAPVAVRAIAAPAARPVATPPPPATAPHTSPIPTAPAVAARPTVRPPTPSRPIAARAPAHVADLRTFQLVPLPQNAHITVDDKDWGLWGPSKSTIELDMSREHELVFRNDECCVAVTKRLGPNDFPEDGRISARLQGKPAYLTIVTDPASKGTVGVFEVDPDVKGKDVRRTGAIGSVITVPFTDDTNMTKTLEITISAEGRTAQNHKMVLRAAQTQKETVKLID
jgi:tRNA A-37 threonylcarbamoyl transferase component Bud32